MSIAYPRTLESAYLYVNERYVFNQENYPALNRLNEQEQFVFKLNHILLHMLKSVEYMKDVDSTYREQKEMIDWSNTTLEKFMKIVINCFTFAEVVGFKEKIFTEVNGTIAKGGFYKTTMNFITKLGTKLEQADHRGYMSENSMEVITTEFFMMWSYFIWTLKNKKIPWEFIPQYMKSK